MSKEFGHTKTLFIQGGKYKWSYKYEYCINCLSCDAKHKGNGLCTRCHDKIRNKNNQKRKVTTRITRIKYLVRIRINKYLIQSEKSKMGPVAFLSNEDKKIYKKQWYIDNYERISLERLVKNRLKNNLPCLKIIVNGIIRYLPFEDLEKPKSTENNFHLYEEWKVKKKQFNILKEYYEKETI